MAGHADRVAGCLVDLAVGDALGAPLEYVISGQGVARRGCVEYTMLVE